MGNRLKLPKVVARRKPRLVPNKSVIRRRESSHIGDPFIDDPLVGDPLAEASRLAADAMAKPMTLDGVAGKSACSLPSGHGAADRLPLARSKRTAMRPVSD